MNIINILNNKELEDIPILYILRVLNVIQKENLNGQSSTVSQRLYKSNKSIKE